MAEKQKLIELIKGAFDKCCSVQCENCEYEDEHISARWCQARMFADFLLSNGVTFATDTNVGDKWRPASEPPEVWRDKNGTMVNYLIYMPEYGVDVGNYVEPAKRWLCVGLPVKVTHWMPLPQPPKEGK